MANQVVAGTNSSGLREYRKGNWTIEETMVLIEAKKLDEKRRSILKRETSTSTSTAASIDQVGSISTETVTTMVRRSKGSAIAELRWKWVEDYCWSNGCFRSQNQCNDKWDNLIRDFKKVRDYENSKNKGCSYWKMDKSVRKEMNLPSNMLPQVYEGLVEVMERKGQRVVMLGFGSPPSTNQNMFPISAPTSLLPLPPPPSLPPHPIVDTETSGDDHPNSSDSTTKRRRVRERERGRGRVRGRISHAITQSVSAIAEDVQASEESEETRHRELLSLHQRRLRIVESTVEIEKQGFNGLINAINDLANSIHALTSHNTQPGLS